MSSDTPVRLAEFARIAGYKPSYVHQLKRDGRLVLAADGKSVLVTESLERIRATRDPARADVSERHAAARSETAPEAPDPDENQDEPTASGFQEARALKEHYLAMAAKRDYEVSIGKLMDADQVALSVADAVTTLRTALEGLPDILGPQLVAIRDESKVRAMLAESIEHALNELARRFQTISRQEAA